MSRNEINQIDMLLGKLEHADQQREKEHVRQLRELAEIRQHETHVLEKLVLVANNAEHQTKRIDRHEHALKALPQLHTAYAETVANVSTLRNDLDGIRAGMRATTARVWTLVIKWLAAVAAGISLWLLK